MFLIGTAYQKIGTVWSVRRINSDKVSANLPALQMVRPNAHDGLLRGTAFNSYTCIVRPMLQSPNFRLLTPEAHTPCSCSGPRKRGRSGWRGLPFKADGSPRADRSECRCDRLRTSRIGQITPQLCFQRLPSRIGQLGRVAWAFPPRSPPRMVVFSDGSTAPVPRAIRLSDAPTLRLLSPAVGDLMDLGNSQCARPYSESVWSDGNSLWAVQIIWTMIPSEACVAKPSTTVKDEFGLPALDVCIRYSDVEVENVVRARQHLMNLMEDAGCRATLGEIYPSLFPGTIAHYGGTARMHAKPQFGVTDAWNRVYDAPNVLVCDAACFTTAAEKNPTLTVMAIAARAATRLAHDLKHA